MKQHLALLLRCRQCGQVRTARNFIGTFEDKFYAMYRSEARRWLLDNAGLNTIHECDDGRLGISDVIGMRDVTGITADHPSGIKEPE